MKEKKIEILDSIRGIACLIVLTAHIVASSPYIGKYANGCGKIGVWCFMIMSGFLSIHPYINGERNCKEYNAKSITQYYLKKVKTLYPTFMVALLLGIYTGLIPNLKSAIKHLICLESIGHFWYMPVIIKFYIIFPVFVFLYRCTKNNKFLYGILIALIAIVISVVFPFTKCAENSNLLRWYVPVFCMGIFLALIYNTFKEKILDNVIFDVICMIFIASILIFTPYFRELIWKIPPNGWLQNKYLLMGTLWSAIIISILFSKYIKKILAKCRIFAWLSVISYEMYLIHYTVLLKLNLFVNDVFSKAILVVIISILLSVSIHYLVVYVNKRNFSIRAHKSN